MRGLRLLLTLTRLILLVLLLLLLPRIILRKFKHVPVEDIIIRESLSMEEVPQQLPQVRIVWFLFKSQGTAVGEVGTKLGRIPVTQDFNGSGHLLFTNSLIFLPLCCCPQSLPREGSSVEVHQDEAKRLQVISSRLLHANVSIDRGISGRPSEVFVLPIRDV